MEKRTSLKRAIEIYMEEVPSFFIAASWSYISYSKAKSNNNSSNNNNSNNINNKQTNKKAKFLGFFS